MTQLQDAVCVIYNPASGRGRASRRLDRLRRAWRARAVFWPTTAPGEARELARKAALAGYATIAAAGGDGTVHEVANGLLEAGQADTVLAVIPAGSANDYAHSLGLDRLWWQHPDLSSAPRAVDVGIVRAPGRRCYFVNGLGLGFNGIVTHQSRRIPHLQGPALYGLALLRTLCFHYELPSIAIRIDETQQHCGPTLALSLALGQREGNFVVAPRARLDDGLFDFVLAGSLSRWQMIRLLPWLVSGRGLPHHHPQVQLGHCRRVHLQSEASLTVHTDGELFCTPADGVRDLQIELLPAALRVLGRRDPASGGVNPCAGHAEASQPPLASSG